MKKLLFVLMIILVVGILPADSFDMIENSTTHNMESIEIQAADSHRDRTRTEGDLNFGSEYQFQNGTSSINVSGISVSVTSETNFTIAYKHDWTYDHYGISVNGYITGFQIFYGDDHYFQTIRIGSPSTTNLSPTSHVVVAYSDYGGQGVARVLYGGGYVFNSGLTYDVTTTSLDATHFVIAYQDHSIGSYLTAVVGTDTDHVISYGYEYPFYSAKAADISVITLDADRFVVAYRDITDGGYGGSGTAVVGTVSGNTITYGSVYEFNADNTFECSAATLDDSHFVVTYRDEGNSSYGTAIIGTVSGSTITYGSEFVFNSDYTDYISTTGIDADHFVVAYRDLNNNYYGAAIAGIVSSNDISYGSEQVFNYNSTGGTSISTLDATKFVIAYNDSDPYSDGSAIIGEIEIPPPAPANVIISIVGDDVHLNWDDPGDVTWNIYRSADPYSMDWGAPIGDSGDNLFIDVGAALGGEYYYYITANN